jgi:alkylation response protein AidB-like acyl-CoA dehydrogenase
VEGGFEVSGTVRFVSGCHEADWLFVIGLVPPAAAGGRPEPRVVFVEQPAVEILDTWHVMGMRATGSCDVRLDRVVVADELTASMVDPPRPQPAFTGASYRLFPWTVIAGEAAVSVGIAHAAVDLVVSMAGSTVRANSTGPIAEREAVQAAVGRGRALVEAARAALRHALGDAWSTVRDGRELGPDQKVSLQLAVCLAADHGARAVDMLYEAVGTAGFVDAVGLERHFRDAHVLTQHGTKSAMRFASAGKVMLGLPSDTAILG